MILLTTAAFLLFVLYVEQYAIRMHLKAMRCDIYRTWGRADWVYPCVRERRTWMRTNTVKSYE